MLLVSARAGYMKFSVITALFKLASVVCVYVVAVNFAAFREIFVISNTRGAKVYELVAKYVMLILYKLRAEQKFSNNGTYLFI